MLLSGLFMWSAGISPAWQLMGGVLVALFVTALIIAICEAVFKEDKDEKDL